MAWNRLPEVPVERLLQCQRQGVCDTGTADICAMALKPVYRLQRVAAQRAVQHHQQSVQDVDVMGGNWMRPMPNRVLKGWNGCIRHWPWGAGSSRR